MDTQTIDQRIRERARKELKERIDFAFRPAENILRVGYEIKANVNKSQFDVWELVEAIKSALFDDRVDNCEEKAVKEFIAKVDGLEQQIDDLRNSVE